MSRARLLVLPQVLDIKELLVLLVCLIGLALGLLGILGGASKLFSASVPASGGTLREGIVGNPRFMNPVLSQTDADRDIVELVYSGLLRHDGAGNLIPALAEKYEVSNDGLTYIIVLKPNLRWSDGKSLTTNDVTFTIQLAKNPIVQSPRRANWEGVEVEVTDSRVMRFHLKKPYAPFIENLTLGIMPEHLWNSIPPSQLSLAELNTKPIGAGPYSFVSVSQDSLGSIVSMKLKANKYFVLGTPYLNIIQLVFYPTPAMLLKNMQNQSLDSTAALSSEDIETLNYRAVEVHSISLQRIIAVFFNQSSKKFFSSLKVRQALREAVDKNRIVASILQNYAAPIDGPLPLSVLSSHEKPYEMKKTYDLDVAKKIISAQKSPVSFTLTTTANTPEFIKVAELLKEMWKAVGIEVEIKTFGAADLESLVIGPRRFDAFLYGEEVIGKRPDPFAFWHSSQRTHPGLNIALYANSNVDTLLEKARAENNPQEQDKIYRTIHETIRDDIPAVFLYSPSYLYVTPKDLGGVDIQNISTASDRFDTIHQWYLKRRYVWKVFLKKS